MKRRSFIHVALAMVVITAIVGCGATPTPTPLVVEKVVTKEVPKEVVKEVTKVVEKPVEVTKVVEKVVTPTPAPPSAAAVARAQTLNVAVSSLIADPTNYNIYAPGVDRNRLGLHQLIYE